MKIKGKSIIDVNIYDDSWEQQRTKEGFVSWQRSCTWWYTHNTPVEIIKLKKGMRWHTIPLTLERNLETTMEIYQFPY